MQLILQPQMGIAVGWHYGMTHHDMSLLVFESFNGSLPFSLFSEPTAAILESTDGVSDEESQEEDEDDLDNNGHSDTEDDTENQIESINLSSLPIKRKAVLEAPTIALCADNDCGLEIDGIDLLLCDAPGCNLTACKCGPHIFPLTSKLTIFYSQYHMTCRGELSKPQGGWFCDDECKNNAVFRVGKA